MSGARDDCDRAVAFLLDALSGGASARSLPPDLAGRSDLARLHSEILSLRARARASAGEDAAPRERSGFAEALHAAGRALTESLDYARVADAMLVHAARIVPSDCAEFLVAEGERVVSVRRRCRGEAETAVLPREVSIDGNPHLRRMIEARAAVAVPDTVEDPEWAFGIPGRHTASWMGAPLLARDRPVGFLCVHRAAPPRFGPLDGSMLALLAAEAALALDNARLFGDVQRLAITDHLTGLYNRRHFLQLAEREFERTVRYRRPLSVLMIDIDRFKEINDRFGHGMGDRVLGAVAERCRAGLRRVDIIARYGGEEFVVLLPETPLEGARCVAERIRSAVFGSPISLDGAALPVSVSVGLNTIGTDVDRRTPAAEAVKRFLEHADLALYGAKNAGRNRVVMYAPPGEAPGMSSADAPGPDAGISF